MALNNVVFGDNFGDEFNVGTEVKLNLDGTTIVEGVGGVLSSPAENAADTPFNPATTILTSTDTQGAIEELETLISGVTHTSITNIDLQPTGNTNEYTVIVTWVDENGATQTTSDATPVVIAGANTVSAAAGNLITDDTGAFLDSATICTDVKTNCFQDCDITDIAGVVRGTVQEAI